MMRFASLNLATIGPYTLPTIVDESISSIVNGNSVAIASPCSSFFLLHQSFCPAVNAFPLRAASSKYSTCSRGNCHLGADAGSMLFLSSQSHP